MTSKSFLTVSLTKTEIQVFDVTRGEFVLKVPREGNEDLIERFGLSEESATLQIIENTEEEIA